MNELPDIVRNTLFLFTDDTKLFSRIVDLNDCASLHSLFGGLCLGNYLLNYQNVWLCMWITTTPSSVVLLMDKFWMKLLNTKVSELCLIMRGNFTHVSAIVSKAKRTLGMINKCFTAVNHSTLLVLYKYLVRIRVNMCAFVMVLVP